MSPKVERRLETLQQVTTKYSATVQQKLSKGDGRHAAVVQSAAKYYIALKKLAEK